MATPDDDAEVLKKIQETYVPFLKKLIGFLEKNKKGTPDNLTKLRAIYEIFINAPPHEQVETFHANQKKLENWYNKAQKEKSSEDGESKSSKRLLESSDTESSSQGAFENSNPAKRKNFTNAINSESSQPSITTVQSMNQHSNRGSTTPIPISQIKKEKLDTPKVVTQVAPFKNVKPTPTPTPIVTSVSTPPPAPPADDGAITFTCASCQFQTKDETDFMKHARTDHRTDLSMWCKQCGKCFSNAGVLVSHIKERACTKEEMIYKCGVKDCIFETTSGQTFVHHLRHCHKGSPFIFCVHCQKIFTLPHCLILHMQDDCPFKEKNRRNPSSVTESEKSKAVTNSTPVVPAPAPVRSILPKPVTPIPKVTPVQPQVRQPTPIMNASTSRGRNRNVRGRGRGRGRSRISDSSDSDDPDDPSWRPEESLGETGLRRSGRWAKKVNDVMNPEPSTSGVRSYAAKKTFSSVEMSSQMLNCPCCDFMAAFQSVLEDHYIANHKVPNKNACLVCHLKFENTRSFLDHFEEHKKGNLPNKLPVVETEVSKPAPPPPAAAVPTPPPTPLPPKPVALPEPVVHSNTENTTAPPTQADDASTANIRKESFDNVLSSISEAKLADPKSDANQAVKIPYQAAIHDKNLKDSKLKKFEELKSPNDLIAMKTADKLKHFFKCGLYNCTFTTSKPLEFSDHLNVKHEGKRYHCCYCLKEYFNSHSLVSHVIVHHKDRIYQCSKCFYRGFGKAHVQIHINNAHAQDPEAEIVVCEEVDMLEKLADDVEPIPEVSSTTWPYICAIGDCKYTTYDPKDFKKHNESVHRTVSVFFCHYCKVDFLTFKRLMNHYRLHGLNTFQCNYCIHGAETKEEILIHLCNAHADNPLKAFIRGSQEEASTEVRLLNNSMFAECKVKNLDALEKQEALAKEASTITGKQIVYTGCDKELYHVVNDICYPKFLKNQLSDIICGIPFCKEKFENFQSYCNHLRNVHDALNLPCPHCSEMFDTVVDFKYHLLCHGSKLYACGFKGCEYAYWNKDKVLEHGGKHEGYQNEVITIREFKTENDEHNNITSLTLNCVFPPGVNYVCPFCKYKCGDKNIIKNHIYRELAYQRFDCRLCDKKCISRKEVKDHFIKSHPGLDIICSTETNSEVEAIIRTILRLPDKFQIAKLTETCDMCCRKFKNLLYLQSHLFVCLQKEYRPYECSHCKKGFVNMLALKYHSDEQHFLKPAEFSFVSNYAIEEDVGKNLLKVRLKQLKDMFEEQKQEIDNIDSNCSKLKFYTCSICSFEADHKFSVQKHIKQQHEGSNGVVIKGMHNLNSCDSLNSQLDENSNDSSSSGKCITKRYCCGFCIKKMYTIQEIENHVKVSHPVNNTEEYFYYYTPDSAAQFSPDDKDIYECAYCKSTRENLFSLKKHADLMHADMEFKVKGHVQRVQSQNNYLACGYCYLKVGNNTELQTHSTSSHPFLPVKYIGDKPSKVKRYMESDDSPNKRVKFNCIVFVCSHCGGAFANQEGITNHSKKAHSRFQLEFTKFDPCNSESMDTKFYKCEFCKFTSERQFLDSHLASKHKMIVTCAYCNKRFEFASKLKEHHEVSHKNLPLKYTEETFIYNPTESSSVSEKNGEVKTDEDSISEYVSHYGKEPEPIDLSSLTVYMDTKEGQSANLPVMYVAELFNIYPKVLVKDVLKENLVE